MKELWESSSEAIVTLAIAIFSGLGVFIIWLIRLEGWQRWHEKMDDMRFQMISTRLDAYEKSQIVIIEKLSIIEKSLSKIEGQLIEKQ